MNDSIVIDGIALQPKPGHAGAWTYVPRRPTLELDSNGKPLLQVIDAGVTAFLQCTARIALNDAASDALLGRLKQLKPDAQTLEAAALAVERIALEVRSSGEHWTVLAESKASGNPPWTAALAVTLDAPGLAAIKAAMAGERNCARLCARVALPGSPGAARFAAASADARVETPTGSTSASAALAFDASSPARDAKSIDLGDTDIADLFPAGGPVR